MPILECRPLNPFLFDRIILSVTEFTDLDSALSIFAIKVKCDPIFESMK
jgi:hypothetical protein